MYIKLSWWVAVVLKPSFLFSESPQLIEGVYAHGVSTNLITFASKVWTSGRKYMLHFSFLSLKQVLESHTVLEQSQAKPRTNKALIVFCKMYTVCKKLFGKINEPLKTFWMWWMKKCFMLYFLKTITGINGCLNKAINCTFLSNPSLHSHLVDFDKLAYKQTRRQSPEPQCEPSLIFRSVFLPPKTTKP